MEILELLWAIVLLIAVMKYTVLDGFDLGVGALHLCTPKDIERRMMSYKSLKKRLHRYLLLKELESFQKHTQGEGT